MIRHPEELIECINIKSKVEFVLLFIPDWKELGYV